MAPPPRAAPPPRFVAPPRPAPAAPAPPPRGGHGAKTCPPHVAKC
jgi:hypothetical protein